MTPSVENRRPENLALHFQEVLTAIERLRGNRQGVSDANAFRHHAREALRTAAGQALAAGYTAEDVKHATYATVAFLDESVLNSHNPVFADWARKPLQEEMFGTQIAGEVFFQQLQQLLGRNDSADLADLLEVYYLCLVLGFAGRYSAGNRGELGQIMSMTAAKIYRVRARFSQLSPAWVLPRETVRSRRDPWVRKLGIIAAAAAIAMVLLFAVYKIMLASGVHVTVASGQAAGSAQVG
ncbi:MAG TPA: DotU family type IV/VI secretion system protein [Bryobacteraceae bacterium]|nr:DotU family type IV/VI secretion system protein [Bryobacteraceae bacterium]